MNRKQQFMQAYRQAPWRRQIQIIGLFSAVITVLVTGAGIYLHVTESAATLGREIQDMQEEKQDLLLIIEDRQSEFARLTSARTMEQRAKDMGFEQLNPATAAYIIVPGYGGKQTAELAPPPELGTASEKALLPEYTMTLFDWFSSVIDQLALQTGAVQ